MRWILWMMMPLLVAGADVTGTWSVEVRDTPQGLFECELKFTKEGDKLTGEKTCGHLGPFDLTDIKLDDDKLSFTVNAGERYVAVKTVVKGDALEGTWDLGDGRSAAHTLGNGNEAHEEDSCSLLAAPSAGDRVCSSTTSGSTRRVGCRSPSAS